MDIREYLTIVDKYAALLEDLSFMTIFGCSERLLPFPKPVIEVALVDLVKHYKIIGDTEKLELMKTAYLQLSCFLPYHEYCDLKKNYGFNLDIFIKDANSKNRFNELQQKISHEGSKRLERLNEMLV